MSRYPRAVLILALLALAAGEADAYRLIYKEQLYELNHQQLYMYPEDYAANIAWLEIALDADFANPLYALARVETPREWEYYRYLFWMHLNLHLVDQYLGWASKYMKFDAYFFNEPWKEDNLASLQRVDGLFDMARYYWDEAVRWSEQASGYPWLDLEEVQHWADQSYRIEHGELDYGAIIDRHEARLERVRAEFQAMTAETY
ncbi:MAG: hypothetical protein ACOC2Q_01670 [Spirochaetota bacterium]